MGNNEGVDVYLSSLANSVDRIERMSLGEVEFHIDVFFEMDRKCSTLELR